MSRSLPSILLLLAVVLVVVGGSHYWLWSRFVLATVLPSPWRQMATSALILLALSLPAAFASRAIDAPWSRGMAAVGFTWMGLIFLLILGLGTAELGKWLVLGVERLREGTGWVGVDAERRLFLARILGGGAALAATGTGLLALREGMREPELREVTVPLSRLPAALDGLTVVQVSDLHVGPTIRRDLVASLVARIQALKPDLIVLTGDLVDGSVAHLRSQTEPLGQLRAPHGVYAVTGNHEYYSGADAWIAELRRLGIRTLRNERIDIAKDGAVFDLAGIDDWTAHRFGHGHGANLPKALQGRDPTRELVLLAHQPKAIVEAAALGVGLQLSGHTHGGQIWPFGFIVKLVQPYVAGLAKHGPTWIYVSSGTGYWGPPMRLAAPAELTRITLRSEKIRQPA